MKVEVRLYGIYKEAAGVSVLYEDMNNQVTLGELLERLGQKYGDTFSQAISPVSGGLVIYNAEATRDLTLKLTEGAKIVLVPAIPGG